MGYFNFTTYYNYSHLSNDQFNVQLWSKTRHGRHKLSKKKKITEDGLSYMKWHFD